MLESVITGDLEPGSPGWNRIAREPGHSDKMGYKDVKVFYEVFRVYFCYHYHCYFHIFIVFLLSLFLLLFWHFFLIILPFFL